jgi:tRNA (guanine-N7-)-methyltransferase
MTDPDPERASRDRAKPIRSFVVRAGRMGPGQARALATLAPRYVVPFRQTPIDFAALFGRVVPVVVEIGFGMGQATAAIAAARPDVDFLGIEVHPPGVGALLQRIDEAALTNVRIVQHDAVEVLESMVAPVSLAGVHVFFPDPWPKKRHHKRRLIQPPFVRLLASRLAGRRDAALRDRLGAVRRADARRARRRAVARQRRGRRLRRSAAGAPVDEVRAARHRPRPRRPRSRLHEAR